MYGNIQHIQDLNSIAITGRFPVCSKLPKSFYILKFIKTLIDNVILFHYHIITINSDNNVNNRKDKNEKEICHDNHILSKMATHEVQKYLATLMQTVALETFDKPMIEQVEIC